MKTGDTEGEDGGCKGAEREGGQRFTTGPLPDLPLELFSALCLKGLAALNNCLNSCRMIP